MIRSYIEFWTKAFVFTGKATRLQYFIPWIINTGIFETYCFVTHQWRSGLLLQPLKCHLGIIPDSIWHSILLLLFFTFIVFVGIADFTQRARRFHDVGISNWLVLVSLIPLLGPIIVLLVTVAPSRADLRWPINQSEM
ncbi:MAG: DUF805 domain-containing protein [Lentilactobacillus diolivorans]|uniref:DUF805 domain-containing protein n=1 Tax=Lentilactobacillus diolivorans TaxID=179838 RepID=UPI0039EAB9BA